MTMARGARLRSSRRCISAGGGGRSRQAIPTRAVAAARDGDAGQDLCRPVAALVWGAGAVDAPVPGPAERVERVVRGLGEGTGSGWPVEALAPAVIRLDMGRIVAGFVDFAVEAPAGTVFEFHYTEELVGRPGPFGAHGGSRFVAKGQDDRHRVFDKKGFGFAYVLVHGAAGPVRLTEFSVQEDLYPWTGGADFDCSDPGLVRLYRAGRRTVEVNSWDAFIDCPSREQRAWTGDAVVHQMVHLATNADWRLARHYLDLGNSPRPDGILPMSVAGDVEAGEGFTIPDWSLHWVHGVFNLYRFAGDRARVKGFMPTIERVLRWYLPFLNRAGRLQDAPGGLVGAVYGRRKRHRQRAMGARAGGVRRNGGLAGGKRRAGIGPRR